MKTKLSVNIEDFGADRKGKTDSYCAIMAAIDFAVNRNIGLVRIPGGTFVISSSLPLRDAVFIKGNGMNRTTLKSLGNFPVFKEIRTPQNPIKSGVSDMNIVGGGKANSNAHGIVTEHSNRSRFENLSFRSCRHALDITHSWQMFCINVHVEGKGTDQNYIGWYMHETEQDGLIDNAVQAVNCYVQEVEKFGFRLINFQGSKFVNCEAAGEMECGWYLGDPTKGDTKISWGHFTNCLADSTMSDGWRIIKGRARDLKEIQFSNCWSGNTKGHGVHIQGADGIAMSNWLIIEPHQCGINLENSNRVAITSCSIREFNKSGGGYAGINILNSSQNIISSNHCYSNQGGGGGGRGVDENGNSNFNIVTSNNLSGSLKRGENSIFANNIGQ